MHHHLTRSVAFATHSPPATFKPIAIGETFEISGKETPFLKPFLI
jgi:hypothetical protein